MQGRVAVFDGDYDVGRDRGVGERNAELRVPPVVEVRKDVVEYYVADRVLRLIGRGRGKSVAEYLLFVHHYRRRGPINVAPYGLTLGEDHSVRAESVRGPGRSGSRAEVGDVGIAVIRRFSFLRGLDPVYQMEAFLTIDPGVDILIVIVAYLGG